MIEGLIGTARRLASSGATGKPRQSDLRRSISTAYYALFHAFAKDGADLYVGASTSRPTAAWTQAYRGLDHGFARNACLKVVEPGFPAPLVSCAATFVWLQGERHTADYDPVARFTRGQAVLIVAEAEQAIRDLRGAGRADRRAFAVQIRMKPR